MPNTFAYVALFLWPVLALLSFRRLALPAGVSAAVIGGYLLLPEHTAIDLAVLPPLDKQTSAVIAALVLVAAAPARRHGGRRLPGDAGVLPGWIPRAAWVRWCLAGFVLGFGLTGLMNSQPLVYGPTVLGGLSTYDSLSMMQNAIIAILPFLLARKYLASQSHQVMFLWVLVIAAVLYALPALYEVRMSPQLHARLYGFLQHDWIQHKRGGGWRPIVFLNHGLWLSLFFSLGFLAAAGLLRLAGRERRLLLLAAAGFLFATLVLSKSLGALIIATLLCPVMFFGTVRMQLLVATAISLVVLLYPALRAADAIPLDTVLEMARGIDAERASSLQFRLQNEDILLDKAHQSPVFGWGEHARWRVFAENGRDITVSDGLWVIVLGSGGWLRYLSLFGLLCLPSLLFLLRGGETRDRAAAVLSLLMAANLIDLIPNAGLTPITWMIAGSLAGRLERGARASERTVPPEAPPADAGGQRSPYAPVLRSSDGHSIGSQRP